MAFYGFVIAITLGFFAFSFCYILCHWLFHIGFDGVLASELQTSSGKLWRIIGTRLTRDAELFRKVKPVT